MTFKEFIVVILSNTTPQIFEILYSKNFNLFIIFYLSFLMFSFIFFVFGEIYRKKLKKIIDAKNIYPHSSKDIYKITIIKVAACYSFAFGLMVLPTIDFVRLAVFN